MEENEFIKFKLLESIDMEVRLDVLNLEETIPLYP